MTTRTVTICPDCGQEADYGYVCVGCRRSFCGSHSMPCNSCLDGIPQFIRNAGSSAVDAIFESPDFGDGRLLKRGVVVLYRVTSDGYDYETVGVDNPAEVIPLIEQSILEQKRANFIWIDGKQYNYKATIQATLFPA